MFESQDIADFDSFFQDDPKLIKDDGTINVYTIQMAKWRLIKDTDIKLIDVTIKGKDPLLKSMFAPPSYQLVFDYKSGKISKATYEEAYLEKLRKSVIEHQLEWHDFLYDNSDVAIACFCNEGTFCHRHPLVEFMKEYAKGIGVHVNLMGEIK